MWGHVPGSTRGVMKRAVIGLTTTAMIAAAGSHFVMPDVKRVASYEILNVAAIDEAPSTVGISEGGDFFHDINDKLLKPNITAAEVAAIRAEVDQRLQKMKDIGVTNVRVLVPWANIELKDPDLPGATRNWAAMDMIVNAANAKGMGILGVLNSTPTWATESSPVNGQPKDVNDFAAFAKQVALRYGDKISAYEIWNEPNAFIFWNPVDPVDYTKMLKAAYTSIKQAAAQLNIDITVIGGVVGAGTTLGNWTMNPVDFVKAMYNAGANGFFDALSFHPYDYYSMFGSGNFAASQVKALRDLMDSYLAPGQEQLKMWISEYGLPTNLVTEAAQQAYIQDFISTWQKIAGAGPIFLYTLLDSAAKNEDLTDNEAHFGLYYEDGTPKPIALILKKLIEDLKPTTPTTPANPVTTVLTMLGQLLGQIMSFVPTVINTIVTSVVAAITQLFSGLGGKTATTAAALSAARTATVDGVTAEDAESAAKAGDETAMASEEKGKSEESAGTEETSQEVAKDEVTEATTVEEVATEETVKTPAAEESVTETPVAEETATPATPAEATTDPVTETDTTTGATESETATKPETPVKDEPAKDEPAKDAPSKDEPSKPESTEPESTKPESTKPESTKPESTKGDSTGASGAGDDSSGTKATRSGGKSGHPERGTKPKSGDKPSAGDKPRHGGAGTPSATSASQRGNAPAKAGASTGSGAGGAE